MRRKLKSPLVLMSLATRCLTMDFGQDYFVNVIEFEKSIVESDSADGNEIVNDVTPFSGEMKDNFCYVLYLDDLYGLNNTPDYDEYEENVIANTISSMIPRDSPISLEELRIAANVEAPLSINEIRQAAWPYSTRPVPISLVELKEASKDFVVEKDQEVNLLTRSGRMLGVNDVDPSGKGKAVAVANPQSSQNLYKPAGDEEVQEDPILTQLKRTQADISLWSLLISSYPHKLKLEEALSKTKVFVNATPDEACQLIGTAQYGNIITFTDLDLPAYGSKHNESLHITVPLEGRWIPHVLIDNGSAMNVLPAKMMSMLDINAQNLKPSNQTIKAYDSTSRAVLE